MQNIIVRMTQAIALAVVFVWLGVIPIYASSHQCLQATEYRGYPCDSPIHGGKYTTKSASKSSSGASGTIIVFIIGGLVLAGVCRAIVSGRKDE